MTDPEIAAAVRDGAVRIQRRRTKGWRMPEGAACVDRSTPFGNPFPISSVTSTKMGETKQIWCVGTWTGPAMWFRDTKEKAAALSVAAFRTWVWLPAQATLREKAKIALRGKSLACWCSLDSPCHGDVWLEIANAE